MNLAQAIDAEAVREGRIGRPMMKIEAAPRTEPPGARTAAVLAALAEGPLAAAGVHAKVGGSKSSVAFMLCTLKKAGKLTADTTRYPAVYALA